jgi:hypothetical protein
VNGRKHAVKVIGGEAKFEKGSSGRTLLRIKITAEVDGMRSEYTITFGRYGETNVAWASPTRGPTPPAAVRLTPRDSPP